MRAGDRPELTLVATSMSDGMGRRVLGHDTIVVMPELAEDEDALTEALVMHRPDRVVVGATRVSKATMSRWVDASRKDDAGRRLSIIRRGTGLAAIDRAGAAQLGVDVFNTPDVNAPHLADWIVSRMGAPTSARAVPRYGLVGLLGAGSINGRVAAAVTAMGMRVLVLSPSLGSEGPTRHAWLDRWVPSHRERIGFAATPDEVFGTDAISIAVPLTRTGPAPTAHLVTENHIRLCPSDATIVSISEPEVWTRQAIVAAHGRRDLTVVIDNDPRRLDPTRELIEELSSEGRAHPRFVLSSAAMKTPECSEELDQASLLVAGRLELERMDATPPQRHRAHQGTVLVIGGGILGLSVAIGLRDTGWERVRVVDATAVGRDAVHRQGTTLGGADARHISNTETIPHANRDRRDALQLGTTDGGWQLRDITTLNRAERRWTSSFVRMSDRPGLHAVATDFVVALNRLGHRDWHHLYAAHGSLLAGMRMDERIPVVCLSQQALNTGLQMLLAVNTRAPVIQAEELRRRYPALQMDIAGAVEIDGHAVNVHGLVRNMASHLIKHGSSVDYGVRVVDLALESTRSGVRVTLGDGTETVVDQVVVATGADDLRHFLDPVCKNDVQRVLGCWLTIQNPGLDRAMKVRVGDPLGVVNITLSASGEHVHVSGGFGYVGQAAATDDAECARDLLAELEALVRRLFPSTELFVLARKTCPRPMTPDGLPVIEPLDRFEGRVLVVGGTNAGGTVQAPALARLICGILDGQGGCAQLALHPDRASLRWS